MSLVGKVPWAAGQIELGDTDNPHASKSRVDVQPVVTCQAEPGGLHCDWQGLCSTSLSLIRGVPLVPPFFASLL